MEIIQPPFEHNTHNCLKVDLFAVRDYPKTEILLATNKIVVKRCSKIIVV